METVTAVVIGILFAAGLNLYLRRHAFYPFVGLVILSHAVNLLLFSSGGLVRAGPPLQQDSNLSLADPVPQSLALTAIVIGLGVQTFVLVLLYRLARLLRTPDLNQARHTEGSDVAREGLD